eukprot:GFUD01025045.1.p1 GENE.GFUD01025045.1~~GFUD01025045.1.p1  ORF type:complete len:218 (-),score=40.11 GFUD01025045.1:26-679(-)
MAEAHYHDSPDMFDSPDLFGSVLMDTDASEDGPREPSLLPIPLHELSLTQINGLDPYRDDPLLENLKPEVLKAYLDEKEVEKEKTVEPGLGPETYCTCGNCTKKPSLEESVCCKSMHQASTDQGCIVNNEYVDLILRPVMLEVSLRNVWSMDSNVLRDNTLSNKNYRYAAYRNLFFFLFRKNVKRKNYRVALPSCLVERVRVKYPEDSDNYVGFMSK